MQAHEAPRAVEDVDRGELAAARTRPAVRPTSTSMSSRVRVSARPPTSARPVVAMSAAAHAVAWRLVHRQRVDAGAQRLGEARRARSQLAEQRTRWIRPTPPMPRRRAHRRPRQSVALDPRNGSRQPAHGSVTTSGTRDRNGPAPPGAGLAGIRHWRDLGSARRRPVDGQVPRASGLERTVGALLPEGPQDAHLLELFPEAEVGGACSARPR